ELDIDDAHLAFGIFDFVDALLLLLDRLVAAAAERAQSLLDLGHLGGGHLLIVLFGEGKTGGAHCESKRKSHDFHHAKSSSVRSHSRQAYNAPVSRKLL